MNREPDTWVRCGLITLAQLVEGYTFGLPLFMRMTDEYDPTKKESAEGRRILTQDTHLSSSAISGFVSFTVTF
jgi:hypothetical protein